MFIQVLRVLMRTCSPFIILILLGLRGQLLVLVKLVKLIRAIIIVLLRVRAVVLRGQRIDIKLVKHISFDAALGLGIDFLLEGLFALGCLSLSHLLHKSRLIVRLVVVRVA